MNDWFRAYNSSKDDPKLLLLPTDALRWQWFVLLCVASQHEGKIPSLEIAALGLRLPPVKAARVIAALHRAVLLDETPGGYFHPHNWSGRQYKSDQDPTRNERQQRHRDAKRNALRNGQSNAEVTREVARTDTDTDADTDADEAQRSITTSSSSNSLLSDSVENVKEKRWTPPKHCAVSGDRKRIYIQKDTPEWEAYSADFRTTHRQEPQPNSSGGKWFLLQGEAA